MSRPVRLQLSRTNGFHLQGVSEAVNALPAVNCARPGKWGNPFVVGLVSCGCRSAGECGCNTMRFETAAEAVEEYRIWSDGWRNERALLGALHEIAGKNLACWCRLCEAHKATGKPFHVACADCAPCHVDVLGPRANRFCEAVP